MPCNKKLHISFSPIEFKMEDKGNLCMFVMLLVCML